MNGNGSRPRTPPHSEDAEKSLLGAALLDADIEGARDVSPHDLYSTAHARIWASIRRLDDKGDPWDATIVREDLLQRGELDRVGGDDYLERLVMHVPSAAHLPEYARIVSGYAKRRHAIHAAAEIAERAYEGDPGDALEELVHEVRERGTDGAAKSPDCPSVADLLAKDLAPRQWILEGWLQEAKTMLLYGTSYTGKSLLATQMALAIARGEGDVLGHKVRGAARKVLLFMGENDELELRATVEAQIADGSPPPTFRYCDVFAQPGRHHLGTSQGLAWYREAIASTGSQVAILDNLMSLAGGDLKDSECATSVMEGLKRISKELGTSWIVLAHTRKEGSKGDEASVADRLYGAHEWISMADSAVHIGFEGEDRENGRREVTVVKIRGAKPSPASIVAIDGDTLTAVHVAEKGKRGWTCAPDTVDEAVEAILTAPGLITREEIATAVGVSPRTVRRLIVALEERASNGEISVAVRNRKGHATAFSRTDLGST